MNARTRERALERIQHLALHGLDVASFFGAATEALADAVPNNGGTGQDPYWYTLDPATLLITSTVGTCDLSVDSIAGFEYIDEDFNKIVEVAKNPRAVQTLDEVTEGKPERSAAYCEYSLPRGVEHEALVALRSRRGENWGAVRLVRTSDQGEFDPQEFAFLQAASPYLAEGVRRALLMGEASDPERSDAPGLVVFETDWSVHSLTPGVEELLEELDGEQKATGPLPVAVLAVAARALAIARGQEAPDSVAAARVLTREGRWFILHGAVLDGNSQPKTAVIIEHQRPSGIAPLLMALHGLTAREQEITGHVLRGDSTARISASLHLSPHTVQEHLKSIFEKTGVRSRRELVGKVFLNHYRPRLGDNSRRRDTGKPIRGRPFRTSER